MEFKDYLKILVQNDGSDLYLTVDAPPPNSGHTETAGER
jgi:twitching motility protein PilU